MAAAGLGALGLAAAPALAAPAPYRLASSFAAPGGFSAPYFVKVDPSSGDVWVSDEDSADAPILQRYDPTTGAFTVIPNNFEGSGQCSDTPSPCFGTSIDGVAVDAHGTLYVSDHFNYRIVVRNPDGSFHTLPASGINGALALSPDGKDLYVANPNDDSITELSIADGSQLGQWKPGSNGVPTDIATSPAGDVYVADTVNDEIQELSPSGTLIRQSSDPGLGDPVSLAIDQVGDVFVADRDHLEVREYTSELAYMGSFGAGAMQDIAGIATGSVGGVDTVYAVDPEAGLQRVDVFQRSAVQIARPTITGLAIEGGRLPARARMFTFTVTCPAGCMLDVRGKISLNRRIRVGHPHYTTVRGGHRRIRVRRYRQIRSLPLRSSRLKVARGGVREVPVKLSHKQLQEIAAGHGGKLRLTLRLMDLGSRHKLTTHRTYRITPRPGRRHGRRAGHHRR